MADRIDEFAQRLAGCPEFRVIDPGAVIAGPVSRLAIVSSGARYICFSEKWRLLNQPLLRLTRQQ